MVTKKKKKLISVSKELDKKYGTRGTKSRDKFTTDAYNFYYGEILKERRKKLKISQEELANKIGKPRPFISQVENGRNITLANLILIAQALGLSFEFKVVES